jgi:hypothetical protein
VWPYRVYADISPDYYCAAKAKGALFNRLRLGLACEHQIRRLGVAYIQVWLFQIAINKQLDLLTDVARVASSIWQSEQVHLPLSQILFFACELLHFVQQRSGSRRLWSSVGLDAAVGSRTNRRQR